MHVASLKPPNYKLDYLGDFRVPELKMYPAGMRIMDDIVLTGLLVQRRHLERFVFYSVRI